jgi:hypothetical protein
VLGTQPEYRFAAVGRATGAHRVGPKGTMACGQ